MKTVTNLITAFILLTGCSGPMESNRTDLKPFYFNFSDFTLPVTYRFVNTEDSADYSKWVMKTETGSGDTLFITRIYDVHNRLQEESKEKITRNGAMLASDKVYTYTTSGDKEIAAEISDSDVFLWNMESGDSILWQAYYPQYAHNTSMSVRKTRILQKLDIINQLVIFRDKIIITMNETGQKTEYEIESHYYKGIGLSEFKTIRANGITSVYRLVQ